MEGRKYNYLALPVCLSCNLSFYTPLKRKKLEAHTIKYQLLDDKANTLAAVKRN